MLFLLLLTGAAAGLLGALLGIGGGVFLVPTLTMLFHLPMEQAVPLSLACVVANSCGATANLLEERLADLRLALTLELGTAGGAVVGGAVAGLLAPAVLAVGFGAFSTLVAAQLLFSRPERANRETDYDRPVRVPLGVSGSFVAGGVSALLGVGGGPIKVPLMTLAMRVPMKVATATSNVMVGVTGAVSIGAYLWRGATDWTLAPPLVIGALGGAWVGSRVVTRISPRALRYVFAGVLVLVAARMLWEGGGALWRTS